MIRKITLNLVIRHLDKRYLKQERGGHTRSHAQPEIDEDILEMIEDNPTLSTSHSSSS